MRYEETILIKEFREKMEFGQIKKQENGNYRFTKVLDGSRYSCTCSTPEEAAIKILQKKDNDIKNKRNIEEKGVPFQDVAIEWFETNVRDRLSNNSVKNVKGDLNNHILEVFGTRGIKTIKNADIQKFINSKSKKYSESTIKKYKQELYSIFEYAIDNDYAVRNPAKNVSDTSCKEFDSPNKKPVELDELIIAFKAEKDDLMMIIMLTLFYVYGLRPCELIKLKWNNINFEENYIFIEKSKLTGSVKTKNKEKTKRYLTLTPTVKMFLGIFLKHQKENNINTNGFVFYRKNQKSH